MKRITLSADGNLITEARSVARAQGKTLSAAFREWLIEYTEQPASASEVMGLYRRLTHVKAGRHFTRQQMNER